MASDVKHNSNQSHFTQISEKLNTSGPTAGVNMRSSTTSGLEHIPESDEVVIEDFDDVEFIDPAASGEKQCNRSDREGNGRGEDFLNDLGR